MKPSNNYAIALLILCVFTFCGGCSGPLNETSEQNGLIRTIEDWNRLTNSKPVRRVVCSGSGALRLITYLQASDKVVAVERLEQSKAPVAPYRLAHPEYATLPLFGEGHGRDNVEFLLSMTPKPDVIIRIDNPGSGIDPRIIQERTGIPVVLIPYADWENDRETFDRTFRLLGHVLGKTARAEELLAWIDSQINDLKKRTGSLPVEKRPVAFLGGLSFRGSHGINSTTLRYPPFEWLHITNPVDSLVSRTIAARHAMVSKEQIVVWNPDYLFVDLGTLGLDKSDGLTELHNDTLLHKINALKSDHVYTLYPNNSYNTNFAAQLVNAWFIGKTIYPDLFKDVELDEKIDEVFRVLTGSNCVNAVPERLKTRVYKRFFWKDETMKDR